jgi:hypothetical protein
MDALLTLAIYLVPFLIIAIAAKRWVGRKGVGLSDVHAEGSPGRTRARFLLGVWRRDDPP